MLEKTALSDREVTDGPESVLEHNLITEYLRDRGYELSDLKYLPEIEADILLKEACRYATLRLAEIEARCKFRRKIEAPQ